MAAIGPWSIRAVTEADLELWLDLRRALWPEESDDQHRKEIAEFFAGTLPEPQAVLLACDGMGTVVGLVELSVRPFAEGCRSRRVAYLEGWYVAPYARGQGVGRALLRAAEDWGRAQGCTEFASDTEPDNANSSAAHLALGFEDVGLVRCFRKDL
jgi:aminoglycoside 6'-N-acetyltransferase I